MSQQLIALISVKMACVPNNSCSTHHIQADKRHSCNTESLQHASWHRNYIQFCFQTDYSNLCICHDIQAGYIQYLLVNLVLASAGIMNYLKKVLVAMQDIFRHALLQLCFCIKTTFSLSRIAESECHDRQKVGYLPVRSCPHKEDCFTTRTMQTTLTYR